MNTEKQLRQAVTKKCLECMGTTKASQKALKIVEDCTSPACPLFDLRPRPTTKETNKS